MCMLWEVPPFLAPALVPSMNASTACRASSSVSCRSRFHKITCRTHQHAANPSIHRNFRTPEGVVAESSEEVADVAAVRVNRFADSLLLAVPFLHRKLLDRRQ